LAIDLRDVDLENDDFRCWGQDGEGEGEEEEPNLFVNDLVLLSSGEEEHVKPLVPSEVTSMQDASNKTERKEVVEHIPFGGTSIPRTSSLNPFGDVEVEDEELDALPKPCSATRGGQKQQTSINRALQQAKKNREKAAALEAKATTQREALEHKEQAAIAKAKTHKEELPKRKSQSKNAHPVAKAKITPPSRAATSSAASSASESAHQFAFKSGDVVHCLKLQPQAGRCSIVRFLRVHDRKHMFMVSGSKLGDDHEKLWKIAKTIAEELGAGTLAFDNRPDLEARRSELIQAANA
jgi:hypothetical protein